MSAVACSDAVAVVGMACRLPGNITSPKEFWEVLFHGRDVITDAAPEHPRSAILPAGILSDDVLTGFDHAHFALTAEEAAALDPQQRWGPELVDEALQHAGIAPSTLRGSRTGVWWGSSFLDQAITHLGAGSAAMTMVDTAAALPSMAPGRISRAFDLRGPSELVDTACSASLVALHRACQALRLGEVDLAVVGGANALVLDTHTRMFRNSGALSPTGRTRPFAADADGFIRGEGAAVVILQRLSDAHRAGAPVRACVLASATNNDGASPGGVGAPSHRAQAELLRRVYTEAGIDPAAVDYVQTHGTGTRSGDNAERAALDAVLGRAGSAQQPVWLGSVKSNVGHLEGAAGLASLIATVLALQNETIPPTAGHTRPMPQLHDNGALRVPTQSVPWPAGQDGQPRLAAVSAVGFSGTNAHAILAEPPPPLEAAGEPAAPGAGAQLVPISAAGQSELATTADAWAS
ncbi:beta-ketoacyl [acyl carrier protein] synthase domain-containing protein, partial [Allosalinactinospora lopnorensis]|uniref:beta-ketoacyl [acyl carrier protein] synthase domain-containing protein n=1 Tax=Allosalinactinospora lopnorensis TaxID=1352348 RepID=UPI000623F8B0